MGVKMRKVLLTAILGLSGTMAQAQDWSGAYGVLGASGVSGDWEEYIGGSLNAVRDNEGHLTSLGLGYNLQQGSWVFGGEIAFSNGHVTAETFDPSTTYLDRLLDLKGRVGYAAGRTLFYGILGWSSADRFMNAPQVTNEPIKATGMSLGLGVDYLISDHIVVGIEALQRNMAIDQGEIGGFPILSYEHPVRTIGLRLGFKF